MTTVTVCRTHDGFYDRFECHGHAGYAEEGEDIVCAGISALVINTVNCLQDLLKIPLSVEYDDNGNIECHLQTTDERTQLLIDSMIHGLEWIQIQYGKEYLTLIQA
ncbi:MAG: ribosomal-processing cysteine protease Prp [Lachnospiraceae bacterium]|nr:ribosomal-processing cysteine protease Prp [Lachnospiraceae bacterium]